MNNTKFACAAAASLALVASAAFLSAAVGSPAAPAAPATPAEAAEPAESATPAASGRVPFAGCVEPGVEDKCLVVQSGDRTYNVTSGASLLTPGKFAAGTGVVSDGVSVCQQGDILTDIVLDDPQPSPESCQAAPK